MLFDNWDDITRVLIVGILAYAAVVFLLRISGKRTLSKWNSFDFIVTIALGSVLASVILSKDVSLLEGIAALAVLIFLQFVITKLSVYSKFMRDAVKDQPEILLYEGKFLEKALKKMRVTESEVLATIRASGIGEIEEVGAVILETDGSFSVIKKSEIKSGSTLRDVGNLDK